MFKGILLRSSFAAALGLAIGCSNLPGSKEQQGAVIGGVTGAAVGAAVGGEKHRVIGAVIGGAAGAAGGYAVGANIDKIIGRDPKKRDQGETALSQSFTPQQAASSATADINRDGFVTLDEVVAMKQAGLTDGQMIDRLRATGQVFDLSQGQKDYLMQQGVSADVVNQMPGLNTNLRR